MAKDQERKDRNDKALADSSLDAFVCCSPTSVLLLSGYWPVMGASLAILTSSGKVRVLLPEDEMEIARASTEATLIPYKPFSLKSLASPLDALGQVLKKELEAARLSKATIGIESDLQMQPATYSSSVRFHSAISDLLRSYTPDATQRSCQREIADLKAVKTSRELELIAQSARIAADGFRAAPGILRPGLRESEIAAAVHQAFESSTAAKGVQRFYGFFFCMSGPNSAKASGAFARTGHRVIEDGDLVLIHANTCSDGYWTDITRTYTVGESSERNTKIRAAIDEARAAAIASIHPGAAAAIVDHCARTVMVRHGFGDAFRHSTGHGVGFAAANPNAMPRIHPNSPDVLKAGMTFNVEPAAYFDGYGGMRHCDMVTVTPQGATVLTEF